MVKLKTLIHNVEVITMDKDNNQYKDGAILYNGDTIEYVGPASGLNQNNLVNAVDKPQLIDLSLIHI